MRLALSWLACAAVARAARHLTPAQRDAFFEDGLVVLGTMLDEADVAAIEVEYDRFMSGIHADVMGKVLTRCRNSCRLIDGVDIDGRPRRTSPTCPSPSGHHLISGAS